jgi:hypothetical protein
MTQVCLLDSVKLSALLQDALAWSSTVDSIMVSATNGSILATASRGKAPEIKDLRTLSTTMTAAYTVASENTLVFEAQATGALSVIVPVADHVLLAVNGPPTVEPDEEHELRRVNGKHAERRNEAPSAVVDDEDQDEDETAQEQEQEQTRVDLESVSEELADILKRELSGLNWPQDI